MKIVINNCWGGFGLSRAAVEHAANLGSEKAQKELDEVAAGASFYGYCFSWDETDRIDPILIQTIEALGEDAASGEMAKIKLIEIPDGVEFEIDNYDGMESVHEKHRVWS